MADNSKLPLIAGNWKMNCNHLEAIALVQKLAFTLRPNVKFASGNPMTASDFKWSFERLMNIKGNGAWLFDGVQNVSTPTMFLQIQDGKAQIVWPKAEATAPFEKKGPWAN